MDVHVGTLFDVSSCHSLRQHVTSPAHVHGHTLDLLITCDDQTVMVQPARRSTAAGGPLFRRRRLRLFVAVEDFNLLPSVRNWRAFDVDTFADDLQSSDLIKTPADDVETGVDRYNSTLRALLDEHVHDTIRNDTVDQKTPSQHGY